MLAAGENARQQGFHPPPGNTSRMPTSMEAHARAVQLAQEWLKANHPEVRRNEPHGVHVDARDAGEPRNKWRCELAVPHPFDTAMQVTAAATGFSRDGALEAALMELRGFVQACYLDEPGETRRILAQREQLPYEPSAPCVDRALRCLRDRQVLDVSHHRVGAVGMRLHNSARGLPVTVGDVVAQILSELADGADDQMRLGA